MVTVDAAVGGNRELDKRAKEIGSGSFAGPAQYGAKPANGKKSQGVAQAISGYQDPDVCCEIPSVLERCLALILDTLGDDIQWIRSITKLPLVIKGIQCVEVRFLFFSRQNASNRALYAGRGKGL